MQALAGASTTGRTDRERIIDTLANAIRDPRHQRDVYTVKDGKTIYQGRLDQLLHQILVTLTEGRGE